LLIVVAAIDFFDGGQQVSLRNNLLGLPLDILVVIALSAQSASLWARRPRAYTGRRGARLLNPAAVAAVQAPADDTTLT
jgi:hypothetical protein